MCLVTYSVQCIVVVGKYVQYVKARVTIKVSGLTICVYSVFLTWQVATFAHLFDRWIT